MAKNNSQLLVTPGRSPYAPARARHRSCSDCADCFTASQYNGVQFYLGDDSGILHSWTDTTVQNGQKYYYAVRAFDRGYAPLDIAPAESNLKINVDNVTGEVESIGPSVAIVVPEAPVAGYKPPSITPAELVTGSTTGTVGFEIVDQTLIKKDHTYRITFEDTTI